MGRTGYSDPLERPALEAWCGASLEVRDYIYALERRVLQLQHARVFTEQLQADELRRRDRIITEKDLELARLEQENRLLRERLRLTSRTSSKPPSSDPPSVPKRVAKKPSGKRRGGQPGHPKHERALVPTDECQIVVEHRPAACASCLEPLSGEDPEPLRHQTVELPVVVPHVTEHRLHSLRCSCGHLTRACLPEGTNGTGFGPRLEATVATLAGACRLSHRAVQSVLADMFGVRVGLGSVTNILSRVSRAVEAPVSQAREHVREADETKHADETGWFQRGADGTNEDKRRAWLWVAATAAVVAFTVALSRGRTMAREVIGELAAGVLVSDRYSAYAYVGVHSRQLCWAHLVREFERISERSGPSGRVGRGLRKVGEEVFSAWHAREQGTLGAEAWVERMGAMRQRARELLERGARFDLRAAEKSERSRTRNTCAELLKLEPAMWTFVGREGVPLTNNAAERQLRHAVLWRRSSFGSQSEGGAETSARLLTVVMTRKVQGKSAYEYFVAACEAAHEGREAPPLIA